MICNPTATTNVPVEMRERTVHFPAASKPQKRRKVRENPNRTVIAVIMPWR
jgi:hypothetical protein